MSHPQSYLMALVHIIQKGSFTCWTNQEVSVEFYKKSEAIVICALFKVRNQTNDSSEQQHTRNRATKKPPYLNQRIQRQPSKSSCSSSTFVVLVVVVKRKKKNSHKVGWVRQKCVVWFLLLAKEWKQKNDPIFRERGLKISAAQFGGHEQDDRCRHRHKVKKEPQRVTKQNSSANQSSRRVTERFWKMKCVV